MSTHSPFMNLWNFMELSEKQRLMRQFLSQHGDHFSKEDFVKFLARRYEDGRGELKPRRHDLNKGGQRA